MHFIFTNVFDRAGYKRKMIIFVKNSLYAGKIAPSHANRRIDFEPAR